MEKVNNIGLRHLDHLLEHREHHHYHYHQHILSDDLRFPRDTLLNWRTNVKLDLKGTCVNEVVYEKRFA